MGRAASAAEFLRRPMRDARPPNAHFRITGFMARFRLRAMPPQPFYLASKEAYAMIILSNTR